MRTISGSSYIPLIPLLLGEGHPPRMYSRVYRAYSHGTSDVANIRGPLSRSWIYSGVHSGLGLHLLKPLRASVEFMAFDRGSEDPLNPSPEATRPTKDAYNLCPTSHLVVVRE